MWIPEAVGREPFAHAAYLLDHTERLSIATGIANIWARDAITMGAASKTVAELSGGRFLLGIGVSHKPLVSNLRGHNYDKPYSFMKEYLPKMKGALYLAPAPKEPVPVVLAALHPKMLALSASEANGTHTYFVPPEHTAKARAQIGPNAMLCAAQATILETDAAKARKAAREYMKTYVPRLPNYTNNLKALGWDDKEFENGCSDRLVDAIVAWGTEDKIRDRIDAHLKAGASHVCILPLRADGTPQPDLRTVQAFAQQLRLPADAYFNFFEVACAGSRSFACGMRVEQRSAGRAGRSGGGQGSGCRRAIRKRRAAGASGSGQSDRGRGSRDQGCSRCDGGNQSRLRSYRSDGARSRGRHAQAPAFARDQVGAQGRGQQGGTCFRIPLGGAVAIDEIARGRRSG